MFTFIPNGVCSREIQVDVKNGVVGSIEFVGGCNGNLKGISQLVSGMKVDEAIKRLKGITCGSKHSSCPDQLAVALEQAIREG